MTEPHHGATPGVSIAGSLRARSLELLEFSRICEILSSHAQMPITREMALSLQPSYDPRTVASWQQETAEARLLLEQGPQPGLSIERDIRPLLERLAKGGLLIGEELLAVAGTLELIHQAKGVGMRLHAQTPLLRSLSRSIPDLRQLEQEVRRNISTSGEVADDATPYLWQLRHESRTAYRRAAGALERLIDSDLAREVLQEHLITVRAERLVVPVKAEFRSRMPGIVHDVSDSGATLFIEPMSTVGLCNTWREAMAAEQEEAQRVVRRLCASLARRVADMGHALELAGRIDLALAKARYAQACNAGPVRISTDGISLVEMRHPLLPSGAVPVSLALEPPVTGLVVTGPNMGGKTVALKAVGLAVLMHQAGLQVPAEPATRLPIVDGAYADIGDQQSIEQSVSTFSSHISNITRILEVATPRSLVLLDELGTSTDPEEASALARSILAWLAEHGVLTVVTTHHRTVAAFAEEHPALENSSVELHPLTLQPTYRITMGLPGRSYAMAVAERLGLDPQIIAAAHDFQDPSHQAAEALLAGLQEERHHTRQKLQETEEAQARVSSLQQELEGQLEELVRAREQVEEETKQRLQAEAKELRSRLKRAEAAAAWEPRVGAGEPPPPRLIDEARAEVSEVQRLLRSRIWGRTARAPRRRALAVGDVVEVSPLSQRGTVTSLLDVARQVEVQVGSARVRLDVSNVRKVAAPRTAPPGITSIQLAPDRSVLSVDPELDLRGLRLHDSLERLDVFLDNALAQGRVRVRIIHGKGTGALRQGVWKHLASHPSVPRYDFADARHGGDGATEVELA